MVIFLTNAPSITYPKESGKVVEQLIRWFRDAPADAVAAINGPDGAIYVQKRHIVRIDVA